MQYKEKIEQLRESVVLNAEITGERLNLEKLAKEMAKEATWIKSAIPNAGADSLSELNNDVVITTTDGYIYQMYYSDSFRSKFYRILRKRRPEMLCQN